MKTILALATIITLSSCATMSNKALSVQIHSEGTNLVDKCDKIGPVHASDHSLWDINAAATYTKVKMREIASDMGADTLVMLNLDPGLMTVHGQGIAYKCHKK